MPDENDKPLTEEELALAREGEALVSAAVAEVHAPQSLREAIERERERATAPQAFWRRHRLGLAMAGTAATVLVAIAIALVAGGGQGEPSLGEVYAAAGLAPDRAAPAVLGGDPPVLDAKVDEVEFPDWREKFGWRAVGQREDSPSGRPVTTVSYRNADGARLGYAVVSGDALGAQPPGRQVEREGNTYNVAREGGRTIVTWTQQGQTCVIVTPSPVPPARLVDLAASRNV